MKTAGRELGIDQAGLARLADLILSEGVPGDRESAERLISDRLGPYGARLAVYEEPIARYFSRREHRA